MKYYFINKKKRGGDRKGGERRKGEEKIGDKGIDKNFLFLPSIVYTHLKEDLSVSSCFLSKVNLVLSTK